MKPKQVVNTAVTWYKMTRRTCKKCGRSFLGALKDHPNDNYCLSPCRSVNTEEKKNE